jgi:3'-5' exoribonuclease
LLEHERVIEHYLVKKRETRESKAGKTFLSRKLSDKTGILDGKIWEINNHIGQFAEGDIVKVDGTVTLFNGEHQLKIIKIRQSYAGEYEPSNYMPTTERDIDEMFAQLTALIEGVGDAHIKALLAAIILDETRAEALKMHPAAMHMHHAYVGGLLEHTLSVAGICTTLAARYPHVNRDMLLAGALLHDIGKIYELTPVPMTEYTDDGQMLGHIIIGVELVTSYVAKIPNFPHETASLIKHMLLSHHGEYEFGSPKLPMTSEAMILHYADNIDAKLTTIEDQLRRDKSPGKWTPFSKALGRYLRKP